MLVDTLAPTVGTPPQYSMAPLQKYTHAPGTNNYDEEFGHGLGLGLRM